MEIWKQYKDSNYEVSTDGMVRNIKTGRILKHQKHKTGYLQVVLYINRNVKALKFIVLLQKHSFQIQTIYLR